MTKTQAFESLDGVRQLLQQVETRKSNFDYNLSLLERERDLLRVKSAWESLWQEGCDSERGRARYLVNKSIVASQSEIQKSVDKGLRDEMAKMQDPGGSKYAARRSGKSVTLARSKFATSSRLLRAKASSCERCLTKSERTSPQIKPRSVKVEDNSAVKPKSILLNGSGNATLKLRPQLPRQSAVSPRLSSILQSSSSPRHHFSTRSVLSEKAVRVEERREVERQKNEAFIPLAIWQSNSIPTFCKATSTSSVSLSKSEDPRPGNVGVTTLKHQSMKPELKIQVMPSVEIEPINDSRPYVNVHYAELTRDSNEESGCHVLIPQPSKNAMSSKDNQSAIKRTGKFPLTKELTERVMAICKEKMMTNLQHEGPTVESQTFVDPEAARNCVAGSSSRDDDGGQHQEEDVGDARNENTEEKILDEDVGGKVHDEDAGDAHNEDSEEKILDEDAEEKVQQEIVDLSSKSETSSSLSKSEALIPTPDLTPVSTPSPTVTPPLAHRVQTPPLSRLPSSDESESDYAVQNNASSAEQAVFTPDFSPPDSVSQPDIPHVEASYPRETEASFGTSVAENVPPKSLASKCEIDQPRLKSGAEDGICTEVDYSIGQVPVREYRRGKRREDSEDSSASTPEGMEHFELEADFTNATTSTTYSEGEVKPFRLHRLRNFDQMLALLNRAQLSQISSPPSVLRASLGQSGFCFPPEVLRDGQRQRSAVRPIPSPDSKYSEQSLGEVEAKDQNRTKASQNETKFVTKTLAKQQESVSEGEIGNLSASEGSVGKAA